MLLSDPLKLTNSMENGASVTEFECNMKKRSKLEEEISDLLMLKIWVDVNWIDSRAMFIQKTGKFESKIIMNSIFMFNSSACSRSMLEWYQNRIEIKTELKWRAKK